MGSVTEHYVVKKGTELHECSALCNIFLQYRSNYTTVGHGRTGFACVISILCEDERNRYMEKTPAVRKHICAGEDLSLFQPSLFFFPSLLQFM